MTEYIYYGIAAIGLIILFATASRGDSATKITKYYNDHN